MTVVQSFSDQSVALRDVDVLLVGDSHTDTEIEAGTKGLLESVRPEFYVLEGEMRTRTNSGQLFNRLGRRRVAQEYAISTGIQVIEAEPSYASGMLGDFLLHSELRNNDMFNTVMKTLDRRTQPKPIVVNTGAMHSHVLRGALEEYGITTHLIDESGLYRHFPTTLECGDALRHLGAEYLGDHMYGIRILEGHLVPYRESERKISILYFREGEEDGSGRKEELPIVGSKYKGPVGIDGTVLAVTPKYRSMVVDLATHTVTVETQNDRDLRRKPVRDALKLFGIDL